MGLCWSIVRWFDKWLALMSFAVIYFWLYHLYVVDFCCWTLGFQFISIIYVFFYHFLYCMTIVCLFRVISAQLPTPPDIFKLPIHLHLRLMEHVHMAHKCKRLLDKYMDSQPALFPVRMRLKRNGVRYCFQCQMIKPDRAHHCSTCGKCVLKLDHHCWMINACIHFNNYKFFILFLFYGTVQSIFTLITVSIHCIFHWQSITQHQTQLLLPGLAILSFIVLVLFVVKFEYFASGLFSNKTTVEGVFPPHFIDVVDPADYDFGISYNWRQVFGQNPIFWFLPVRSSLPVDGYDFIPRKKLEKY